jgi:hypothetical protein
MFSEVMVKEGFAAKYTCGAASTCRARFQPQSVRLARPTPARGGVRRGRAGGVRTGLDVRP